MSCQLHAPAALAAQKDATVLTEWEAGWGPEMVSML
jgi:hypothetical protein